MGFDKASCQVLIHARRRMGVELGDVLTLGRQELLVPQQELRTLLGDHPPASDVPLDADGYAEPLFLALGARMVDSLDLSDYESATVLHDLNVPAPAHLHEAYDTIVDGGTIEHVFNFPNAIESCMRMLRIGGHYIGFTPANNSMGHGFYQFSPELYYRVFSPENGFEVQRMWLRSATDWYEVADPDVLGRRGQLVSSVPLMLVVVAKKLRAMDRMRTPQQSDYVKTWEVVDAVKKGLPLADESGIRRLVRRFVPTRIKTLMRNVKAVFTQEHIEADGLGMIDSAHFKRVDL